MFGFGKKRGEAAAPKHSTSLNLGTGNRDTVRSTKSSEELAVDVLREAQEQAKNLSPGQEVTIEITTAHPEVHHLELLLSLMELAPKYGLQAGVQFNNQQTFTKV